MSDLIERQEAIDAMTSILWHYPNECYRNLNEYEFAKGLAELGLKSVPSAQQIRTQMSSANDLISRRLAIDKFAAYIYHAFKDFYRIGLHRKILTPEQCRREARNVLAEVPSAQPKSYREGYQAGFKDAQPDRKRGKWIDDGDPFMWVCDVCGYRVKRYNNTRYCPNCGAEMRGDADE